MEYMVESSSTVSSSHDPAAALLDAVRGKPEEHAIKLGLLKSLKRAAYSPDPLGHYGLSKTDYCHFTSPMIQLSM